MLLSGQDGAKLAEVLKENKKRLYKIFQMLKPWEDGIAIDNKIV